MESKPESLKFLLMNFLLAFAALTIIIMIHYLIKQSDEKKRLQTRIDYFNYKWKTKNGGTTTYNGKILNYSLHSFDTGKTWYVVEKGKNDEFIIVGNVETVYPGLLEHLDAWDRLTDYVRKNGAIQTDSITPELDSIMSKAHIKLVKQ